MTTHDQSAQQPHTEETVTGPIASVWRRFLAIFLAVDIFGLWILAVRLILTIPSRALILRLCIFVASVILTLIGLTLEHYLIPGVVGRAGKKLALYLVVGLVALYVLTPAIKYFRGDDDIYIASIFIADGRKLADAQKVAATLRVLNGNGKAYRVELSKADYMRLRKRAFRVQLLQSPSQQYKAEQINARPPGVPDKYVEQIIHAISSDSLMHHIQRLERFGTRRDHTPQADSAAEYIANTMKRYGLDVESLPFDSPIYAPADAAGAIIGSRNICGTLRGNDPSNAECIIVAHYDSVHLNAPGANDNASGVAAVLEAARICSQYKFAYTIRFLAVGAEEIGLVGSYHYARDAKAQKRNIIAVVTGDMLGYPIIGDINRLYLSAGREYPALMDSMLIYNRRYNLNFVIDGQIGGIGGSDHESFLQAGFPAVDISEGNAFEIWNGMDPYYHSPLDTSDKLNPDLLRHCAQLMTAIAAEMARPFAAPSAGPH